MPFLLFIVPVLLPLLLPDALLLSTFTEADFWYERVEFPGDDLLPLLFVFFPGDDLLPLLFVLFLVSRWSSRLPL